MNTYISVNIVPHALLLLRAVQDNQCYHIKDVDMLKLPYGVNSKSAIEFARQCNWLKKTHDAIQITPTGNVLLSQFDGSTISASLWRTVLQQYIEACRPVWARRIPYGRQEAFLIMNEEEQRCFNEAELMDNYNQDVIEWWDSLAEMERMGTNSSRDIIGRCGEQLTMKYEEQRTGVKPNWRSVETNLEGFDILSQKTRDDTASILIEVKTTTQRDDTAPILLSRNEWNIASKQNNLDRYLFYIWKLSSDQIKLAIIGVDEMLPHVPRDAGEGRWTEMKVPVAAFSNSFIDVFL